MQILLVRDKEKNVTTLTLGLRQKQKHGKVQAKTTTWESHLHFWE